MKKSKVLLTLTCAALLVVASVMGTMAYLTSTDKVTNVFTVGQVHINLDEAVVDKDGDGIAIDKEGHSVTASVYDYDFNNYLNRTSDKQTYHLVPGHEYVKDPTVTVLKGSDDSYVRMLVNVTLDTKELKPSLSNFDLSDIVLGYDENNWKRTSREFDKDQSGNIVIKYEYRYNVTTDGIFKAVSEDTQLPPLFTGIDVPDEWDNAEMSLFGAFTVDVVAQAIQADGFADANAAWAAWQ